MVLADSLSRLCQALQVYSLQFLVWQAVVKEKSRELFSAYAGQMRGPKRWVDLWSAGHTVSAVERICTVAELVDEIAQEYDAARALGRKVMGG